jgi:N-acetylglucosamine kinase-like BadF-type ATPase
VSAPLAAVLAIDGGNSKTDAALVGADGTLLALVRGPGLPPRLSEETVQVLGGLTDDVLKQAGREPVWPAVERFVACVANADLPAEERQLERMLGDQGWALGCVVANDTYAVLRAGLDDVPAEYADPQGRPPGTPRRADRHWGVGVTCGTGINCVAIAPDGQTVRFLALGEITGDWGGGLALGLAAQWHAARAADGRGPATVLRHAIPAHFGLAEPDDVAIAVHQGRVGFDELAGLAPVVFRAATAGDEVARGLVQRLADEVSLLARSAIRRLGLAGAQVPVVLGGGILAAADAMLIGRVTELITAEVPGAVIRVVAQPPVVGAALMGLDLTGAPARAMSALRRSFVSWPGKTPLVG